MIFHNDLPATRTDKLCLISLAGILLIVTLAYELTDGRAIRGVDANEPDVSQEVVDGEPLIAQTLPAKVSPQNAVLLPFTEDASIYTLLTETVEDGGAAAPDASEGQDTRREEDGYMEDVPLPRELQWSLREACDANNVPLCLVLGLIEVESDFQEDAVSSEGCVGLMQLNPKWFPADLDPADNIRVGVEHLGSLLKKYEGDTQAALRAYNRGWDDGDRAYAHAVLAAAEKWGRE